VTPLHESAAADAAQVAKVLAAAAAQAAAAMDLTQVATGEADMAQSENAHNAQDPGVADPTSMNSNAEQGGAEGAGEQPAVQWSRFLDPLHAKCGPTLSTPLHVAVENDAAGVVAVLLEAKADPGLGDEQGDTAVHCAMLYGSPRALSELLRCGASAMAVNGSGELPLHLMAEFGLGDAESELSPALLRRHFAKSDRARELLTGALRERGQLAAAVAAEAAGDLQCTPLHAVARWDHPGAAHAAQLLVEARADLEKKNGDGRTALAMAIRRYGKEGRVASLLRRMGAAEPAEGAVDELAKALGGCVRPLCPSIFANQPAETAAPAEKQSSGGASPVELPLLP